MFRMPVVPPNGCSTLTKNSRTTSPKENVTSASRKGNPSLVAVRADVYPPIPMTAAWASQSMPALMTRLRLTARMIEKLMLRMTLR